MPKKQRQHAPATEDPRFARLHTDPRFLRPQREQSKVVVDERFKGLLDGENFGINKRNAKVDRFGRKTKKGTKEEEEMKRLYRLEQQREREEEGKGSDAEPEQEGQSGDGDSGSGSDDDDDDDDDEGAFVDYARGAADLESSSDDDDEDEEDDDGSSGSEDEQGDVAIGSSAVLRRERRRQKAAKDDDDDSEDDSDQGEQQQELDPKILAELDAQAAAAIRQDADAGDAAESSRAAAKKRSKKKKEETVPLGEETRRLAVVNMDWDHIRALDLYKVFSSLVSPLVSRLPGTSASEAASGGRKAQASAQVKGTIEVVRVYPSDFGRERMKKEDIEGPPKDIFKSEQAEGSSKSKDKKKRKGKGKGRDVDDSDDEDDAIFEVDDGGEFDEEALRKYQLERLRYYYAVATFDSPQAARHVYNEIDGTEMERTANMFDLRFVPDDMDFPDHQGEDGWRDEARPGVDDGVSYKGADWATDALRHSKVKLTWDAPDPERQKAVRRAAQGLTKEQLRDEDFKAYLASDSDGEAEEEEAMEVGKAGAGRDRFRSLLGLDDASGSSANGKGRRTISAFEDAREDEDGAEEGDMQITFMPGLSEAAARKAKGEQKDGEETTLEKYLRKQRERKERRKAAREGAADADADEGSSAAKQVPAQPQDADLGFDDPFFASGGEEEDVDFDEMLKKEEKAPKAGKKDKKSKPERKAASPDEDESADEDGAKGRNHFDLKDVLKAETKQGKKLNRWERKKAKKAAGGDALPGAQKKLETQDGFKMDYADARFGAILQSDAHEYALDPSHPSFIQTQGMKGLLQEKRRRALASEGEVAEKQGGGSAKGEGKKRKGKAGGADADADPGALLRAVKEREQARQKQGEGKRRKVAA